MGIPDTISAAQIKAESFTAGAQRRDQFPTFVDAAPLALPGAPPIAAHAAANAAGLAVQQAHGGAGETLTALSPVPAGTVTMPGRA